MEPFAPWDRKSRCNGWIVEIYQKIGYNIYQRRQFLVYPRDKNAKSIVVSGNKEAQKLEMVGLDAYVGFLHRDKPGRASLSLDLMEELRGLFADRFVIGLINTRQINAKGFIRRENGSVVMEDETRREVLKAWQERKRETITHPYLKEKMEWGLVPFVQAMLLARYLRGDLDEYPPFLWK